MPKVKSHRGAAKRFKQAGGGIKRKGAYTRHILTKMTRKRKRHLKNNKNYVSLADVPAVRRLLTGS